MSLGLGSVIATAFDAAPWLIVIGRHKTAVFIGVGTLLAINYWMAIVRPRRVHCPPGEVCHVDSRPMRINRAIFWSSVAIYAGAAAIAWAAPWWVRVQS